MNRLPTLIGLMAAAFLTVGCGEQPTGLRTRRPPPPAFAISDGAHNGGNPGFFLLPPLVSSPSGDREFGDSPFAASAAPRVEICELAGDPNVGSTDCVAGDALVSFSGSQITVSSSQFQVNWRTDQVALNTSAFYRIQVFVGDQLMGFADLDPVASSRELKRAKTGEVIPLVDGRTLPIRFTIEADALCPTTRPCTRVRVTNEGGSFTLPSGTGGILLLDGWLPAGIGEVTLTLEDVALGPDNLCHVPGAFTGLGLVAQFEGCMAITTEPALTPGLTTGIQQPAIIGLCIESDGKNSPFYQFLQLFKSDPGLPLRALEDADPTVIDGFSCEGYTGTPAPPPVIGLSSHSLLHYASSRLDNLTHRLARFLEPRPVYAIDLGEGGELPIGEFFSRFGWGARPSLTALSPLSQSTAVGQVVTVSVQVTGVIDHDTPRSECEGFEGESDEMGCIANLPGVSVTFAVTGGGGTVGASSEDDQSATFSTTTGTNGIATASWTMGSAAGLNTLAVTGAGGSITLTLTANAVAPVVGGGTLFSATFANDALDQPPGTPEVGTWGLSSMVDGTALVRQSVGNLTRALEVSTPGEISGAPLVLANIAGTPPSTGTYRVRWRSVATAGAPTMNFTLRSSSSLIIAGIGYGPTGNIQFNPGAEFSPIVGTWTANVAQLFELEVNLTAKTVRLSIDGVPVAGVQDVAYFQNAATNLATLIMDFGGTGAYTMGWDDIEIVPVPPE